ncbi:MAG: hypothetical protein ACXWQ6_08600 [Candidatus Limnocylindrales bacterium]
MDEHEHPAGEPESTGGATGEEAAGDMVQQAKVAGSRLFSRFSAAVSELGKTAGPTARQVGAKAADVAAVAGEKAGPIAHKVADATEDVGQKLAAKATDVAADLRRTLPGGDDEAAGPTESAPAAPAASEGAPGGGAPGGGAPDAAAIADEGGEAGA